MISEQGWKTIGTVATWLKYGFGAATTALSIVSLRYEVTRKTKVPNRPKPLTPMGRWYQSGVVLLAALTLAATIVGDRAQSHENDADKKKLNDFIAAENKALLDSLDPDIVAVREKVSKTTEGLKKDLLEESKTSTKIQQAQQRLLETTKQTSSQIADNLEETENSILDARLRVYEFLVELYPPKGPPGAATTGSTKNENQFDIMDTNPQNLTPDYRAWSQSLKDEAAKVCAKTPQSSYVPNDPKNQCDWVQRRNRYLFGTNELAKWLFLESDTHANIALHFKGGSLYQGARDCTAVGTESHQFTIPCIRTILNLNNQEEGYNQSEPLPPAESNWVYPFVISSAAGSLLEQIQFDSYTGLPKDALPLVRDLELSTVNIDVCSSGDPAIDEKEKILEDRILRYLKGLPATLTVELHESVLDEKANGEALPSRENSKVNRTYKLVRTSVERKTEAKCTKAVYHHE
jgi:hypothetical protein